MKRQLKFEFENDKYVIKENNSIVFSIDGKDLKFVSLDFYNGIYKDKSSDIELINAIENDTLNKGDYIFKWLDEIVSSVKSSLNDSVVEWVAEIVIYNGSDELHQTQAQFSVPEQVSYEFGDIFRLITIGKQALKP